LIWLNFFGSVRNFLVVVNNFRGGLIVFGVVVVCFVK